MTKAECRGGKRQKMYVDSFTEMFPIEMGQLTAELFEFVEKGEPDDLVVDSILSMDMDGAEGMEVNWKRKRSRRRAKRVCLCMYVR